MIQILLKASYHAGVKLFFSATYYGEGNNERLAGEGIERSARVILLQQVLQ